MHTDIHTNISSHFLEILVELTEPHKLAQLARRIDCPLSLLETIASKVEATKHLHNTFNQEASNYLPSTDLSFQDIASQEAWVRCRKILKASERTMAEINGNEVQLLNESVHILENIIALETLEDLRPWCFLVFKGLSQLFYFRKKHAGFLHFAVHLQEICIARGETTLALCLSVLLLITYHVPRYPPAEVDALLDTLKQQKHTHDESGDLLFVLHGLLHFFRGEYILLLDFYEKYNDKLLLHLPLLHEFFNMAVSLGALFLDKFHISFGIIESFRNTSELTGKRRHAMVWRAHLIFFLLRKGNYNEALVSINQMAAIPEDIMSPQISSVIQRAYATYYYSCGQLDKARHYLHLDAEATRMNGQHGMAFTDPLILKIIAKLEQSNEPILGYELESVLETIEASACRLLRGVALRIHALQLQCTKKQRIALLKESFIELQKTGNANELLQTTSELVLCLDAEGNNRESRLVRNQLAVFTMEQRKKNSSQEEGGNEAFPVCHVCLNSLASIIPEEGEIGLQRMLRTIQRDLGAQRVALFKINKTNVLECVSAVNLNPVELETAHFHALLENLQIRLLHAEGKVDFFHDRGRYCGFLLAVGDQQCWLLYLDNMLIHGAFNAISRREGIAVAFVLSAELRILLHDNEKHAKMHLSVHPTIQTDLAPYFGPDMDNTTKRARHAAQSDAAVLISGETGTGKEQIAKYIHKMSPRKGAFIPIQLSCIPEHLFESELFGHERGSFTGAIRQKRGLIELANEGVLFLDEISEIPLSMQVKLLRVLQEKQFTRVGGTDVLFSNFRLIAASNKDLSEEVRKGRFREDLLYRIATIPLELPPLRSRKRDLPELAHRLLKHYAMRYNQQMPLLDEKQINTLLQYTWPGNIRELCNIMEQYIIFEELHINHRPESYDQENIETFFSDIPSMEALQERYFRFVLEKTKGKIYGHDGAAAILGMTKSTIYKKIEKYSLRKKT